MGNFDLAICPGLSVFIFICHSLYKAWLFEKFISKKMVMSSAKFTNLIPWSPICTAFILLLASVKLASTSATIIYNTNESGHPWRTPCIRVKGSDRRPFISILDWMLVYATLIKQMNFSPYPNFCKTFTILQRGFHSVYLAHQLHHK